MEQLKKFVNSYDIYQAFLAYIEDKIKSEQKNLEQAVKIEDVYRLQGRIIALRRLLNIRDEVNMDKR